MALHCDLDVHQASLIKFEPPRDVHDRKKWRAIGRRKTNPTTSGTLPQNVEVKLHMKSLVTKPDGEKIELPLRRDRR